MQGLEAVEGEGLRDSIARVVGQMAVERKSGRKCGVLDGLIERGGSRETRFDAK